MSVLDQIRVVFYRVHEKGLEVMLINPELGTDPQAWKLPEGVSSEEIRSINQSVIKLDSIYNEDGSKIKTYAVEADWHEIPSVRGIIKHDVNRVKNKIRKVLPELEKATYFQVKEAFKKVLPDEYAALKELKDVIRDKNSVTYI